MKWPKIYHLPNSPGITRDDKVLKSKACFNGKNVVIMEKLDGENISLYRDRIHARSQNNMNHQSQSFIKSLHAQIRYHIPANIQISGEYLYAKHSIFYDQLTQWYFVFSAIDLNKKMVLSVEETITLCCQLGLAYVPILYEGIFPQKFDLPPKSNFGNQIEGYVVRLVDSFPLSEFNVSIAKWVRQGHVQTDDHWKRTWTKNKLKINQN